jgi:hypothetical protein
MRVSLSDCVPIAHRESNLTSDSIRQKCYESSCEEHHLGLQRQEFKEHPRQIRWHLV